MVSFRHFRHSGNFVEKKCQRSRNPDKPEIQVLVRGWNPKTRRRCSSAKAGSWSCTKDLYGLLFFRGMHGARTESKKCESKTWRTHPYIEVVIVWSFKRCKIWDSAGAAKGTSSPTRVDTEAEGARDLTDYLWNFGLIWSRSHGTVAFLKEYFKVIPFRITIPVALLTDVEYARMCILLFHIR